VRQQVEEIEITRSLRLKYQVFMRIGKPHLVENSGELGIECAGFGREQASSPSAVNRESTRGVQERKGGKKLWRLQQRAPGRIHSFQAPSTGDACSSVLPKKQLTTSRSRRQTLRTKVCGRARPVAPGLGSVAFRSAGGPGLAFETWVSAAERNPGLKSETWATHLIFI
jgi:hypothetical protein